ncbi:MAG: hypothetical protein IJX37_07675 [Oscillospiraceae bacterium]|nr:hypothetical protein [Oscillospiraceae bacterium]
MLADGAGFAGWAGAAVSGVEDVVTAPVVFVGTVEVLAAGTWMLSIHC